MNSENNSTQTGLTKIAFGMAYDIIFAPVTIWSKYIINQRPYEKDVKIKILKETKYIVVLRTRLEALLGLSETFKVSLQI